MTVISVALLSIRLHSMAEPSAARKGSKKYSDTGLCDWVGKCKIFVNFEPYCEHPFEKSGDSQGRECDASPIGLESTCCLDNKEITCQEIVDAANGDDAPGR